MHSIVIFSLYCFFGQCENVDIALGVSSSEAPMDSETLVLNLMAYRVRQNLDVRWVLGVRYDRSALELVTVEPTREIGPHPGDIFAVFLEEGRATVDFTADSFNPRFYQPDKNGNVVLAHMTFLVKEPRDTIIEVTEDFLGRIPGSPGGITQVWYCGAWRSFGPRDGRELVTGRVIFGESYAPFIRGDADGNGSLTVSDALAILHTLFLRTTDVRCLDAADANDDDKVNVTDAVFLILHLFQEGISPSYPFPDMGLDPTPDGRGCKY